MDEILAELMASDRTERDKLMILEFIINSAPKSGTLMNRELCHVIHRMIHSSIVLIRDGKDAFAIKQSFRVFKAWSIKETRLSYFTAEEVSKLLLVDCSNPKESVILLEDVMHDLKYSDGYDELCSNVARCTSDFVARHRRYGVLRTISAFLLNFPECIPSGEDLFALCFSLLNSICHMEENFEPSELIEYTTGCAAVIGGLFRSIWTLRANDRVVMHCLKMIYTLMMSDRRNHVSNALGTVVQLAPESFMIGIIGDLTKAHVTNDEQIANIVCRMVDWLSWPKLMNISNWLLLLLQRLSETGRFDLLKQVADEHIAKLFERLTRIDLRQNNLQILLFLVIGNQDSKKTFHEIILFFPNLYATVKTERKLESEMFLASLSVLIRSLILFHAEKPEPYKLILDLIGRGDAKNDYEAELKKQSWTSMSISFRRIPVKALPGKTGLRNSANICFLNSSIQMLAICESFSEPFVRRNYRERARISIVLQKYLVFLKLSHRPSIHLSVLARALLPATFTWGTVQDSSEFFSHLVDSAMEEEKASENVEKLTKDNFYYTVSHSHRCLNCENVTRSHVPNIDLGLAFESEATSGNFGIRGGNQSVHSSDAKNESEDYVRLEDMVSSFLKAEEVSEYDCDECPTGKQTAEKQTTFCEMPNFLKVTLNRFSFDHRGPQKITQATDIPRTLLIPVHRHGSVRYEVFCLVGTIVHVGIGATTGHYYCIVRDQLVVEKPPSIVDVFSLTRDSDFFQDQWYEFNDEDVSRTSFDAFSRSSSSSLSSPYVILYKKVTAAVLGDVGGFLSTDLTGIPRSVWQSVVKDNDEYEKEQEIKRLSSAPSPEPSWR